MLRGSRRPGLRSIGRTGDRSRLSGQPYRAGARGRLAFGRRSSFPGALMTHPRRVFLAGASSLIGVRIIPLLLEAGDTVAAMTRTPGKADAPRALGAEPVVV